MHVLESLKRISLDEDDFDPMAFYIMYMDWVGKYEKKMHGTYSRNTSGIEVDSNK